MSAHLRALRSSAPLLFPCRSLGGEERSLKRESPDSGARPDFTELDVFLGQHILLTLE